MTTEQENTKTKLDRNTGRTEKQDFFGRHQILFMKLIKEILQYSHCYIGNLINQRRGCEHHFSLLSTLIGQMAGRLLCLAFIRSSMTLNGCLDDRMIYSEHSLW